VAIGGRLQLRHDFVTMFKVNTASFSAPIRAVVILQKGWACVSDDAFVGLTVETNRWSIEDKIPTTPFLKPRKYLNQLILSVYNNFNK
jgi:hypothetical protein